VVRTRYLKSKELERWKAQPPDEPTSYRQRDAVLFALRELTGTDLGPTTQAWEARYPGAEEYVKADKAGRALLKAEPTRREALLAQLRDGPGRAYTQALGDAIPALKGSLQERVRGILTQRLVAETPAALRAWLRDDDPEVRQAAVRACVEKKEKALVPDLIALLEDADPRTVQLAEGGLQKLTGKAFGGPPAWLAWWGNEGAAEEGR
jgi:hypothetical protein